MTKPPLAFEDAFELLGPALPGGAIVLVGGQALIYWLSYIRIAHNAIKIVADLASSTEGRAVYEQFQLDALDAIPNDARLGDAFFAEQLPRIRARAGR